MKGLLIIILVAFASCPLVRNKNTPVPQAVVTTELTLPVSPDTIVPAPLPSADPHYINTGPVTPAALLAFAQTLQGIPYKYASTDPAVGFDCSGFITYVFNHFNIAVPRSSVDFTNVHHEVPLTDAKPGDLILFTGTDSTIRIVGHMGILVSAAKDDYRFIHSTSGKSYGVTITPLSTYYLGRFVKVIRVFPQNE